MDAAIIAKWNSTVGKDDLVYFLGDFSFHKNVAHNICLLESLNGKIFMIPGNHDNSRFMNTCKELSKIVGVSRLPTIVIDDKDHPHGKQRIVLCHYPLLAWDRAHYGTFHLHGHMHCDGKDDLNCRRMDVGIDNPEFKIYSYEEIKSILIDRPYKYHH